MHADFAPIAQWMHTEYDVSVLNIAYEVSHNYYTPTPVLTLYLEFSQDASKVRGDMSHIFRNDIQTAIIDRFRLHRQEPGAPAENQSKTPLVFLEVFEEEAFFETCQKITDKMLNDLRDQLSASDLWKIERVGNLITFFVHTEKQLESLRQSAQPARWKEAYLNMLLPLDEFNYLSAHNVSLVLDSRENFQKNFGNSAQYYYRDK